MRRSENVVKNTSNEKRILTLGGWREEGVLREPRRSEGHIEISKLGARYDLSRINSLIAKITRQTLALFATGLTRLTIEGRVYGKGCYNYLYETIQKWINR